MFLRGKRKHVYQHIIEDLKRQIAEGKIRHNEPLPTQIELARMYNTSEITSRRALAELANEGIISRTRGKGSFLKQETERTAYNGLQQRAELSQIYFVYNNEIASAYHHRFFSDLLTGIKEECELHGIPFYIWGMDDEFQMPEGDDIGIILHPHLKNGNEMPLDLLRQWKEEGKRLVTVHFYYPHLQIPYVIVDNFVGGYLATEHLLSLGHERIGIILTGKSPVEMNQEFALRLQGYKLALTQHRVAFDLELVCVLDGERESEQMGAEGLNRLMSLEQRPTAIFATSDSKAIGAIKAAGKRGLLVPDDVSIIGYDDILVSQFTIPSLTTINQNTLLLGKRAAQILLFERKSEQMRDEIVPQLIIRSSTGEAKTASPEYST